MPKKSFLIFPKIISYFLFKLYHHDFEINEPYLSVEDEPSTVADSCAVEHSIKKIGRQLVKLETKLDERFEPESLTIPVSALWEVIDNLSSAVVNAADLDARQGLDMILTKLLDVLQRNQVEPIGSVGLPFDNRYHKAIGVVPVNACDHDKVMVELRKGYTHHGTILRYSEVLVGHYAREEQTP